MVTAEENREGALVEARAWILWGKPLEEVRLGLRAAGFDGERAEAVVQEVLAERAARFRRAGVRDVVLGALLALGCGVLLVWCASLTLVYRGAA